MPNGPVAPAREGEPGMSSHGWGPSVATAFQPWADRGLQPGRVVVEYRGAYAVRTAEGELTASVSGRFRHETSGPADFPAVGDWVALESRPAEGTATIHGLLQRRSRFSRRIPGREVAEQVVAANVDVVLLVMGLDGDFNPRRLERYASLAWASGATPVAVLNKTDLCDDVPARIDRVRDVAIGMPVHAVSAVEGTGLHALDGYLAAGATVALLGSSGVGKSTIINRLLGEVRQSTAEVRLSDARGRHTTTRRELIPLPGGGLVVDTPGMRELALWDAEDGVDDAFAEIEGLSRQCRFSDCRHDREPGCAVRAAIADGRLPAERLSGHRKLARELAALEARESPAQRAEERRRWRLISRASNQAIARKHDPLSHRG
jgi:ribosome biogenesis GTPase